MKLLKTAFVAGDNGLQKNFHIEPVTAENNLDTVQDGSQNYITVDPAADDADPEANVVVETVAKVVPNGDDKNKFGLVWVGEGNVRVKAKADANMGEGVTIITGKEDFELVDEATKLNIVAD